MTAVPVAKGRVATFHRNGDGSDEGNFFIIKPTRYNNFTNLFWHETCRVSCQNKFVKLLHLIGFIIKKFSTMHGHMNVKKMKVNLASEQSRKHQRGSRDTAILFS